MVKNHCLRILAPRFHFDFYRNSLFKFLRSFSQNSSHDYSRSSLLSLSEVFFLMIFLCTTFCFLNFFRSCEFIQWFFGSAPSFPSDAPFSVAPGIFKHSSFQDSFQGFFLENLRIFGYAIFIELSDTP